MIRLNVHDAKTHLSRYLRRLEDGEVIVLCRRDQPIAEIRPLPGIRKTPRIFGLDAGKIVLPAQFFERLDDDTLRYFSGESPEAARR